MNLVEEGLKEGGVGIGMVPGYAPGSGYKELLAVHTLAAKYKVPTYSHVPSEGDVDPLSAPQAYGEIISYAAATGAHVHICHLNSTSFHDMIQAVSMIRKAQQQGLHATVEAYPYGAASTGIGAKVLDPENLSRVGMTYGSVEYLGKRLNESTFKELREKNPGAIVVLHFYELPRDEKLLDMAVLFPGGIIASDAMQWLSSKTGKETDPNAWPLPEDAFSHPRSAGTFARFLAEYVRERKLISLSGRPRENLLPSCGIPPRDRSTNEEKGSAPGGHGRRHHSFRSGNRTRPGDVRTAEPNECRGEVFARQRSVCDPQR